MIGNTGPIEKPSVEGQVSTRTLKNVYSRKWSGGTGLHGSKTQGKRQLMPIGGKTFRLAPQNTAFLGALVSWWRETCVGVIGPKKSPTVRR